MTGSPNATGLVTQEYCAGRHANLQRDLGSVIQATTDLRDNLKEHRRGLDGDIAAINKAISGLVAANGVKAERITRVETKVSWLGGMFGFVGGGLVNFILWLLRGQ